MKSDQSAPARIKILSDINEGMPALRVVADALSCSWGTCFAVAHKAVRRLETYARYRSQEDSR